MSLEDFADSRRDNHDNDFYQSHLAEVDDWVEKIKMQKWAMSNVMSPNDASKTLMLSFVHRMLDLSPERRPTAEALANYSESWAENGFQAVFRLRPCCSRPPEPYVADETMESESGKTP